MALQIKGSSFMESSFLRLGPEGVICQRTAALGGKKRIAYRDIGFVLMSDDNVLSVHAGSDLFWIPTKPDKRSHQEVIETLLKRIKEAGQTEGETA
jgi:hypothetical protein